MLQKCVDMHFSLNFEHLCSPKLKKKELGEQDEKKDDDMEDDFLK